jgi:hypothetical protein
MIACSNKTGKSPTPSYKKEQTIDEREKNCPSSRSNRYNKTRYCIHCCGNIFNACYREKIGKLLPCSKTGAIANRSSFKVFGSTSVSYTAVHLLVGRFGYFRIDEYLFFVFVTHSLIFPTDSHQQRDRRYDTTRYDIYTIAT